MLFQEFTLNIITIKMKIFITGTNRGLGKNLVFQLAKENPSVQLFLTSRKNPEEELKYWKQQFPKNSFKCFNVDLLSKQSIDNLVSKIKQDKICFDVIVNNAAIGLACDMMGDQIPSLQVARDTLTCNIINTIYLTHLLLDNLSQNARVIQVSSKMGGLVLQGQQAQNKINNPNITEQDIEKFVNQYIEGASKNDLKGWFPSTYGTSKCLLNAWSRYILQKKLKQHQKAICISPGPCSTDMLPQQFYKKFPNIKPNTPEQGAQHIYDCIWQDRNPQYFYHCGKQCDYFTCG